MTKDDPDDVVTVCATTVESRKNTTECFRRLRTVERAEKDHPWTGDQRPKAAPMPNHAGEILGKSGDAKCETRSFVLNFHFLFWTGPAGAVVPGIGIMECYPLIRERLMMCLLQHCLQLT